MHEQTRIRDTIKKISRMKNEKQVKQELKKVKILFE